MILLVATAFAADLSDADAERIARLYYRQLGRPVPTAFLGDDIEALQESGHSAAELEKTVLYITQNVPGASAFTLSGILESHLAAALDFEEELVLPEGYDPDAVLGDESEVPEGYAPGPAEVEALLVLFYEGSGRRAPEPAEASDLAAFVRLTDEGWNREGIVTLVSFVPDQVQGAELLSFADAVDVALDLGYLGGPRPRGGYDELEGVKPRMPAPEQTWVVDRDSTRYDGGRTRTIATMGALPAAMDGDAAELPGAPLRVLEARHSWTAQGGTTTLAMGEAKQATGFVVEGLYSEVVPGRSDVDGWGLDGAPVYQDGSGRTPFVLGGRGAVGRDIMAFLPIPGASVGASAWGYTSAPRSEGGVDASLKLGEGFVFLAQAGMGGVRRDLFGTEVVGQTVMLRGSPRVEFDRGYVQATWRGDWTGGGLLNDAPPVFDDEWAASRHHVGVDGVVVGERASIGGGVATGLGASSLYWVERDPLNVSFSEDAAFRELEVFVGAEVNVWRQIWLMGGGRWVQLDGDNGTELAAGARVLMKDWVWIEAEARAPREPQVGVTVAFPF